MPPAAEPPNRIASTLVGAAQDDVGATIPFASREPLSQRIGLLFTELRKRNIDVTHSERDTRLATLVRKFSSNIASTLPMDKP